MLRTMMDYLRFNALKDEEGQGLVEYALIIALIAIVLVAALNSLEGGIAGVFGDIVAAFGVGGGD